MTQGVGTYRQPDCGFQQPDSGFMQPDGIYSHIVFMLQTARFGLFTKVPPEPSVPQRGSPGRIFDFKIGIENQKVLVGKCLSSILKLELKTNRFWSENVAWKKNV